MKTYEILKNPRGSGYLIDDGSGQSIRYATKRLAEQTIAEWIASEANAAIYEAERKAYRLQGAQAYLAARAARRAEESAQASFAF